MLKPAKKGRRMFLPSILIIIFSLLSFSYPLRSQVATAPENTNKYYNINLDQSTIAKGYTVDGFYGALKLSLVPGILSSSTKVEVIQMHETMPGLTGQSMLSGVYQFEFKNKSAYNDHKPFYIEFKYDKADNYLKKVYFFDKGQAKWRELPTKDYPDKRFVRSLIHLPFARIAVFSDQSKLTIGKASWYSHHGGLYAASPDYKLGSRIRVFATGSLNPKFIDITVTDHGPDRSKHPDRVLDLDKVAFSKLALPSEGIIPIRIELLYESPVDKVVLSEKIGSSESSGADSVSDEGQSAKTISKAVAVMDEDTGKILYEKNSSEKLPIAEPDQDSCYAGFYGTVR